MVADAPLIKSPPKRASALVISATSRLIASVFRRLSQHVRVVVVGGGGSASSPSQTRPSGLETLGGHQDI